MSETAPLVTEDDVAERFGLNICFRCQQDVGTPHKEDCVSWRKKVKVRATVEYELEVAHSFDKEMIEFQWNEGTWCSTNMIEDLEKATEERIDDDGVYHSGCLCFDSHFEVIDEFSRVKNKGKVVVFEYACMRIRTHDRARMADPDLHDDRHWTTDEQDVIEHVKVMNAAALGGQYYSYVVAKRRKAGEIEF